MPLNMKGFTFVVVLLMSALLHRIKCDTNDTNTDRNETLMNRIEVFISLMNDTSVSNNTDSETLVNTTVPLPTLPPPPPQPLQTLTANTTEIVTNSSTNFDFGINWDRNRLRYVDMEVLQTNMLDSEVELCKNVVNNTLSHEYGSRKTARLLKTELDQIFSEHKYRFSVVISSDVNYILSKSLYGLWLSMTANGKHYFLIASYKAVNKTNKLSEQQLDRIEDWTSVYFITYQNMTRQSQLDKVTKMTKDKLDLNYGKGNAWAVIAYRHPFAIKGKRIFDQTPHLQFKRLDGSLWYVFRGGEDIPTTRLVKPK